jgi:hypothetical protein
MNEAFKGRANEIYDKAISDCGIIDIDMATKDQRKNFADYMLKQHINFSPQKNRYLYEQLLNILQIGGMFSLKDYSETVKYVAKKEESIVLSSIMAYWQKVEKTYYKYEVILNLFWLKGVEAEMQGKDRDYVMKVIKKALAQIKDDTKLAYTELLQDLDLSRYLKKKPLSFFKIKLFEEAEANRIEDLPDGDTYHLIKGVDSMQKSFEASFDKIHTLLLTSLDTELKLRASGSADQQFIERLKSQIISELTVLRYTYQAAYKELEKKYKS